MRAFLRPGWLSAALLVLVSLFVWKPELATLAAGIALFILGMHHLEDGFKAFTGGALERWLTRSTNRLWKSLGFGMLSTALVQSSSLVTLLSIAFLSAGLISLSAGIGIVFGANLGTTTGAWLIALVGLKVDLATVAMPLLVFGVILGRRGEAHWKGLGQVLLGIGLLFLGIDLMKSGMGGFEGALALEQLALSGWLGVLLYVAAGLVATVLMQSSHATLMITLAALAAGQLSYDNALAMAIGANLGTTITAVVAAIGSNQAGRRLAAAHILFNLVTAAVALAVLPLLSQAVDVISESVGIAADSYTLKLALFHTLFNLLGLVLMVPWVKPLSRGLLRWLPDRSVARGRPLPLGEQPGSRARFLNDASLRHADSALKVLQAEVANLGRLSREVVAAAAYLPASVGRGMNPEQLQTFVSRPVPPELREDADALYDRHIKPVYGDIFEFISRIDVSLLPEQQHSVMNQTLAARDLVEAVKAAKHMQANLRRGVDSQNAAVRAAYRELREQCGLALIDLARLDDLQGDREEQQRLLSGYLDQETLFAEAYQRNVQTHVRNREMDGWQATSLLNDLNYLLRVRRRLHSAHVVLAENHDVAVQPALDSLPRERIEPSFSLP
ncbi:Na/Pi cotransporter family protein [Halopseudomonas nanhaiensis]|uniref:Na/Pi cotransporter family protein n=1 Tax=Halopseudomonas nanhaiensis TaxID=2830842 RepID=UPI001CBFAE30|nr:Na/Pi symporter [Halopseudomonas nanhaiensis]UAW98283.1 Na/Pi cotransporter family protein [Halopseudomonas nanhaiensis]